MGIILNLSAAIPCQAQESDDGMQKTERSNANAEGIDASTVSAQETEAPAANVQEKQGTEKTEAARAAERADKMPGRQRGSREKDGDNEEAEYISEIDFEELWETNEDVIGWIRIEDTCIDYPVLYDPESNEKYLHYDIEGNESVYGSIFLDWEDEPDFSSYHNVIYGHHMRDGSMFKGITYFKDMDYWDDHAITLFLPEKKIELTPFACMVTNSDAIRRKTDFEDEEELQEYIKEMTEGAELIDMPEEEIKCLYSLVTCSYEFEDARTFLYCYEKQEEGGK